MGGGDEIADRLDRADLVVDQHRRDEAAFGDQRLVGRQRLPRAIDRQDRGVQSFEAYQRRGMFDAEPGDAAWPRPRAAEERPVQRLGRARGEEEAAALWQQRRDLIARDLDRGGGSAADRKSTRLN